MKEMVGAGLKWLAEAEQKTGDAAPGILVLNSLVVLQCL